MPVGTGDTTKHPPCACGRMSGDRFTVGTAIRCSTPSMGTMPTWSQSTPIAGQPVSAPGSLTQLSPSTATTDGQSLPGFGLETGSAVGRS